MTTLTTHVLDVYSGKPASGMCIDFAVLDGGEYRLVKTVRTDADGRAPEPLLGERDMAAGRYELTFHVAEYFAAKGVELPEPSFLDAVPVRFGIAHPREHYHVPLLVTPWSYSTYRGS
jgi:hydroxyisourate hydrolase